MRKIILPPTPEERINGFIEELQLFIDTNTNQQFNIKIIEQTRFAKIIELYQLPSELNLKYANTMEHFIAKAIVTELLNQNSNLSLIKSDDLPKEQLVCIILFFH